MQETCTRTKRVKPLVRVVNPQRHFSSFQGAACHFVIGMFVAPVLDMEGTMFVRKTAFEKLLKHVQRQQQEIEKLQEMLGILAQSQGKQFKFVVGEGYKLSPLRPELNDFVDQKRKAAHASDQSS
jgi:hypothetical protein